MSDELAGLSSAQVIDAIAANHVAYTLELGRSPICELHVADDLTWLLCGPDCFFNAVLRTKLERESAGEAVRRTVEHFESRGVSRFAWVVDDDTEPSDLGDLLAPEGFEVVDTGPGMAADLEEMSDEILGGVDARGGAGALQGLTTERVEDDDSLFEWSGVTAASFGLTERGTDLHLRLFRALGNGLPLRSYLGRLDGRAVAASQLFVNDGVAGIYWVATLPEERGRGLGTAMTAVALRDARSMGLRLAILRATEMAVGVYRSLGFREYSRMLRHVRVNPPER